MKKFSIVMVNYCSYEDASLCVNSIVASGVAEYQDITIVDNNSPDGSGISLADRFADCNIVLSEKNGGYGSGVNLGVMSSEKSEIYIITNPDTDFTNTKLKNLLDAFDRDDELGVLGMNLLYPDGRQQYSARTFYTWSIVLLRRSVLGKLPWLRACVDRHLMKDMWRFPEFDADWVLGTGFAVRRTAFEEAGGMDEGYFMYFEDVDLCARLRIGGWRVRATSSVTLIHNHGRDSANGLFSKMQKIHIKSLFRFAKKFGMPIFGSPKIGRMKSKSNSFQH